MNALRTEFEGKPNEDPYLRVLEGLFASHIYRAVGAGKAFLTAFDYPWQALDVMNYFLTRIQGQIVAGTAMVSDKASLIGDVFIGAGARVFPGATISGPVYIGAGSFIANNALVRNCMIMNNCEIGYNSEVARSYIGDNCALHAATVLDSVFVGGINFSAGCVATNLRMDRASVHSVLNGQKRDTGRRKLGALVGRDTFISANSTLMPGVKVGERVQIGPGVQVFDDVADNKRVFLKQQVHIEDILRK
jgi:bifunctional UDP-N-acetylglucosamine pyrophosphorylase/glucosamine-1-phosphate N-acetyltransferase